MSVDVLEQAPDYTQRVPDDWNLLIEFAGQVLDDGEPLAHQRAAAEDILDAASDLGAEALEANRYYGLGLVICEFAKQAYNPAGREQFVCVMAQTLADGHSDYCQDESLPESIGLYVREVRGQAFNPLATSGAYRIEGYQTMPAAQRLVTNALMASMEVWPILPRHLKEVVINETLGDMAEQSVLLNSLSGASAVMRTCLMRTYEHRTGVPLNAMSPNNPPLRKFVSAADIAAIDVSKIAPIAASLRNDEFWELDELIKVDESGHIYIDRTLIPTVAPVVPSNTAHETAPHKKRLRCPALFVAGMIPFVTGTLPEVIQDAQRQILPAGS